MSSSSARPTPVADAPSTAPAASGPHPAWDTLFADDASYHDGHGAAYASYGIDSAAGEGCLVVIRPDQIVAAIAGYGDLGPLEALWAGLLLAQGV